MSLSMHTVDEMADLILANGEKIAKFAKINSLQNYPQYGSLATGIVILLCTIMPKFTSSIVSRLFGRVTTYSCTSFPAQLYVRHLIQCT